MASLYSLYAKKEAGLLSERACFKTVIDSEFLIKRLSKSRVLKGHNGCVNTIAWNESGTRILSGSDDCHLKIYDARSGLIRKSVHTTHRSNIFSARFLPSCGDLRAVSCAGIGSVEYSEFTPDGEYVGHPFHCHNSITYQVATGPSDPNEFFTCEERGNVRLYDLRVRSSCVCEGCKRDILYCFPASVSSMAVHPLSPFYVAFALGDGSVRLVDRRMTQDLIGKIDLPDLAARGTVKQYKPYSIGTQPCKITSIQFNSVGSELLVSYSEDYVYLFNSCLFRVGSLSGGRGMAADSSAFISKPVYLSQLERYSPGQRRRQGSSVKRKPPTKCGYSSSSTSSKPDQKGENVPPTKKLRLRGDWSDTGPEARPENDSEEGGRRDRGILMNRMSRMLAQWIDMSLSPDSNNDSSDREEVPGRYRRLRRRMAPPTSTNDGASPTNTSSATSSNNSFQLFDSDDGEPRQEREGEEIEEAKGELGEHFVTLDSKEDTLQKSFDSPNGSTKTEAVATMDLSQLSKRPITPTQATRDSSESLPRDIPSAKSYDTEEDESHIHVSERQAGLTETNMCSNDSIENRTHSTLTTLESSDCIDQDDPDCGPTASNVAVTIESRTKNSSLNCTPAVVVEGETDSDDCDVGGSCDESCDFQEGSHDEEKQLHRYFMRYKGHRNSRTMIKQTNFWGDNWILSGSDCGRVFVWDKWTGSVVNMLMADSHVVNCVQPHPKAYVLATSGIDYDIKLWEPLSAEECSLGNLTEVVDRNEVMLEESRNTITVPSMFVFRILAYLQRRRRMQQGQGEPTDEQSD